VRLVPGCFLLRDHISKCFPASNPVRQERGNVAKKTGCATKIFKKIRAAAAPGFANVERGGALQRNAVAGLQGGGSNRAATWNFQRAIFSGFLLSRLANATFHRQIST
jgi:hypothetical protein